MSRRAPSPGRNLAEIVNCPSNGKKFTVMLPPVDDQVLRDNPEFARLYAKLTNVVLNPDGTTRHDQAEKKRAAVRKVLPHALAAINLFRSAYEFSRLRVGT